MEAYGFPISRTFTETDCISRLFEMYNNLINKYCKMEKYSNLIDGVSINGCRKFNTWNNGKFGLIDIHGDYSIWFQEFEERDEENKTYGHYFPIPDNGWQIGGGILGYWLKHRNGLKHNSNNLYQLYIDCRYKYYCHIHNNDWDKWSRDFREESLKECYSDEINFNTMFDALSEYFMPNDIVLFKSIRNEFNKYLIYRIDNPELPKSLDEAIRIIANRDKIIKELRDKISEFTDEERNIKSKLVSALDDFFCKGSDHDEHLNNFIELLLGQPKPTEITYRVRSLAESNIIKKDKIHKPLFDILNSIIYKGRPLYNIGLSTWNKQV